MKRVKNILKYITTTFLVLLVSLCIYTFVVTDLMKKDYVNVFGYTYFVVATGSMSGTIEVDDVIFVHITKKVQINDVITFKNKDGDIITHRLIEKKGSNYITKGDINNVADEAITKDQIIGKVSFIISPSFILKSIAIFLIIFILLALVNFDSIIKKYIIRTENDNNDSSKEKENNNFTSNDTIPVNPYSVNSKNKLDGVPNEIFMNPKNRYEETSTGLTVTIAIDEMEELSKVHESEVENLEKVETLEDYDEYFVYEPKSKKVKENNEKEMIDFIVSILKCKKNNVAKARMNKKWLERYQYVYKLCHLLLANNIDQLKDELENPPFKEIYDYDLDRVGLTQAIRNRIYNMPIYVFLRILTYSILYNDDEMFDGIYKIMKYKAMVDKDNEFKQLNRFDSNAYKQVKTLISFMQKVSNKFDNKNVFELEKIERMVKIGKY